VLSDVKGINKLETVNGNPILKFWLIKSLSNS